MISIDGVYKDVQMLANKSQRSGYIAPGRFNQLSEMANLILFNRRYGNVNEYQPGRPVPRVAFSITQKVKDDLRPFIKLITLVLDENGRVDYPSDYIHWDSCRYKFLEDSDCDDCTPGIVKDGTSRSRRSGIAKTGKKKLYSGLDVNVMNIEHNALASRLRSKIVNPTKERPIMALYDTYMQFYPMDLGFVEMTYLRRPMVPSWGYTLVDGRPVYDPSTSIDFEWPWEVRNELIMQILSLLGITIREQELISTTEGKNGAGV